VTEPSKFLHFQKGQAFLGLVMLIGGIILVVGIMVAFLSNSSVDISYGYNSSVNAQAAAKAGIQDALIRLNRNSSYAATNPSYTLSVSSSSVLVSIGNNTPSLGFITVSSTATLGNYKQSVSAVVAYSSSTNQLTVISSQAL
jgi:hypothetical protein